MVTLDAVNYIIGVMGSAPVGALPSTNPDADIAETALTAAIISVTSEGFWFNSVYGVTLSPDPSTSKIDISGYTKVITRGPQYGVQRGDFLFDPINNTFEFDNDVTIDAVAILDFDDLPEIVQQACQFFAASQVCANDLEDDNKAAKQELYYNNAFRQMKTEDLEIKRRNLQQTPRTREALVRVQPSRGVRRYGPNFGGR